MADNHLPKIGTNGRDQFSIITLLKSTAIDILGYGSGEEDKVTDEGGAASGNPSGQTHTQLYQCETVEPCILTPRNRSVHSAILPSSRFEKQSNRIKGRVLALQLV
jgi:hypothetical protein